MSQPSDFPRDDRERIDVRLLRTCDLVDLRLQAVGCTLETDDAGTHLIAQQGAFLVLTFPPQHVGEQFWDAGAFAPPAGPGAPSNHVAAGPSRLVYQVPEGTRINFTLEDILAALPELALSVHETATPN